MRAAQAASSGATVVQAAPAAWCADHSPCARCRAHTFRGSWQHPLEAGGPGQSVAQPTVETLTACTLQQPHRPARLL